MNKPQSSKYPKLDIIPSNIIVKPPTAELRENQKTVTVCLIIKYLMKY